MTELILHLALRSEEDPRFSSTKLNKLLFYCDFEASGSCAVRSPATAIRSHRSDPCPRILSQMQRDGDYKEVRKDYFGRVQRRVKADRPPEAGLFSGEELELLDQVIEEFWGSTTPRLASSRTALSAGSSPNTTSSSLTEPSSWVTLRRPPAKTRSVFTCNSNSKHRGAQAARTLLKPLLLLRFEVDQCLLGK